MRRAIRVDSFAADPSLAAGEVGVPPALAAALLGPRFRADGLVALLRAHPVLVVRERPSSPHLVVALRPVLRAAVSLHPVRLRHVAADDWEPRPFCVVMPFHVSARRALLTRTNDPPPPPRRAAEAAAALGATASLCLDDLRAPPGKADALAEAERAAAAVQEHYLEGVITDDERHHKIVDVWSCAVEKVCFALSPSRRPGDARPDLHARLRALCDRGVMGSQDAMRLAGMGYLLARPDRSIAELPVRRSLAEGLTGHEFFLSATAARRATTERGAREARADRLLVRLARRLRGVRITEDDCGATEGIRLRASGWQEPLAFAPRLRGRVPVADIARPDTGEPLARRGVPLDEPAARELALHGVTVEVRSPATCRAKRGVCRACMGPLGANERHAGLAAALRVAHHARFLTGRTLHIGC